MKLDVPFYAQEADMDCGIAALRMALAFFGTAPSSHELAQRTTMVPGKGLWTLQLATGAARSGKKTAFMSKQIGFNKEHLELDFYKKYADLITTSDALIAQAREAGVVLTETMLPLHTFLAKITPDCVPIALVDWNVILGQAEKGYQGHFVPVVGYDDTHVFIHNPGPHGAQANMPVARSVFDESRKAKGTDEDIVFVYRY